MAVNGDLVRERANATFNPDVITCMLYGEDGMQRRRLAIDRVAKDPAFKIAEKIQTMARDEGYDEYVRMFAAMLDRCKQYGYTSGSDEFGWFLRAVFIEDAFPFSIHYAAFLPTIKGQGTDEQVKHFLPKSEEMEYIGTYAQTELGHGTFLRGLETTAEYDRQSEEFIMHSPTLTAMKYWPGGLGRSCNHAVVMAQLIIDGKQYGMHPFVCQLRDLDTHQPLPGLELGDIGAKMGHNMIDNGYLRFNRYRIPRMNMLMRYAQVSVDGKYTRESVPPQVTYLSMTYLRMTIVRDSGLLLAKAATIATRYSAVRRQTANSKGVEPQVLDYQTQQMKLFPAISTAYAIIFSGFAVNDIYEETLAAVDLGDVSRLPELHSLTSGLKAFGADIANELIETCRRSCGGHGYSHASGIPKIFQSGVAFCTVEGESSVMYLQCARSLLKFLRKAEQRETVPATMKFLAEPPVVSAALKSAVLPSLDLFLQAFQLNALFMIRKMANSIERAVLGGSVDAEGAWLAHTVGLVDVAKAYSRYLTVMLFVDAINKRQIESAARAVMLQVYEFYMVNSILTSSGTFIQNGVLSTQQMDNITARRNELLAALRPNAVALVDAFDYPDRMLNSCLGRYDGNVYEALYEYAKGSSLNKQQVHPSYHKYVKPMQEALKAKL